MLEALQAGLERLDIKAEQQLCSAYLRYIELLSKWNTAYNLTAVKGPEAMLKRHVLDSLSVHSFIEGDHCLDIGTGPGLPGLILALAQPDKHWTLLDSNVKKTRFLQHVKAQLNISNIDIVHSRADSFQNEDGYSTIICRAFSSLGDFYSASRHLLQDKGTLLAMKADISEKELSEVKTLIKHVEITDLNVPEETSKRCVVIMND